MVRFTNNKLFNAFNFTFLLPTTSHLMPVTPNLLLFRHQLDHVFYRMDHHKIEVSIQYPTVIPLAMHVALNQNHLASYYN